MEERLQIATACKIQASYVVLSPIFERNTSRKSTLQKANERHLQDNSTKGQLSTKSISKLRNSINWLIHSSRPKRVYERTTKKTFSFNVNFITLTVPPQNKSVINSSDFQKLLNTFLTYARKYYYLKNYVWKCELHKDGRIHIHITSDTFINYRSLRDCWNRILQKQMLLEDHYSKFGNYNPNSTDIHSVYKVRNVAAYLAKYMSKSPELGELFKGRIWGCSISISQASKVRIELSNNYGSKDFSCLNSSCIEYKKIEGKTDSMGRRAHVADMFFITLAQWKDVIKGKIKDAYVAVIKAIREATPKPPSEYLSIDLFGSLSKAVIEPITEIIDNITTCNTNNTISAKTVVANQMNLF